MYCANCGTQALTLGERCERCGKPFGTGLPGAVVAPPGLPAGGVAPYAGFGRRVAAYLLDLAVVFMGVVGLYIVASLAVPDDVVDSSSGLRLAMLLLGAAYHVAMEASPLQATLGKLALGMKVTDSDGERIDVPRAIGRYVGKYLSGLLLGVGFIMAGFTRRRQGLHDRMAHTLVLRRDATPALVAAVPFAPPVTAGAAVLIILVAASPVVLGILAAIAIPAYQDYTIRAQVAQGLNAASGLKAAVVEAQARDGTWPKDLMALGDDRGVLLSGGARITVEDGTILVVFLDEAHEAISGEQLALTPALATNGKVVWICGYAPVPAGAKPAIEDYADYTTIKPGHLPVSCRR